MFDLALPERFDQLLSEHTRLLSPSSRARESWGYLLELIPHGLDWKDAEDQTYVKYGRSRRVHPPTTTVGAYLGQAFDLVEHPNLPFEAAPQHPQLYNPRRSTVGHSALHILKTGDLSVHLHAFPHHGSPCPIRVAYHDYRMPASWSDSEAVQDEVGEWSEGDPRRLIFDVWRWLASDHRDGFDRLRARVDLHPNCPNDLFPCLFELARQLPVLEQVELLPVLFRWLEPKRDQDWIERLYGIGLFFLFVSDLLRSVDRSGLKEEGWSSFRSGDLWRVERVREALRSLGESDPDLDWSYSDLVGVLRSCNPNLQVGYFRSLGLSPFSRNRAVDLGVRYHLTDVVVDYLSGV